MYDTDKNTPESEIKARIGALQQRLRENGVEGALILQNADAFYFAGTIQGEQLYVPAEGPPLLLIRKSLERARAESAIENIIPMKSPRQLPDLLAAQDLPVPKTLGMELDVLPANLYLSFGKILEGTRIVDVSHEIRRIRAVKSAYEIDRIRRSARFSDRLIEAVADMIREGMTELELAGLVEGEARRMGHQGVVRMRLWGSEIFYGHLMAGPQAALPSFLASPTGGLGAGPAVAQGASFAPIRAGEPILVDYTFCYEGYISDCTRIFAVGGLPERLGKAYMAMIDVEGIIKRTARAGVSTSEVYRAAVERAGELGYGDYFMGVGPDQIRFVGHGVGLELDEFPFLAKGQEMVLESGMVIAVEPKLILPGEGVVGIENTHVVGEGGLEPLTRSSDRIGVVDAAPGAGPEAKRGR